MAQSTIESMGCQSYGIFWDIENCPVPGMKRASEVIESIKKFIATNYESRVGQRGSEACAFYCSCDTKLLDKTHVEALNRSGVDILHVNPIRALNGTALNGMAYKVNADCKLMECIYKYVDHHFNTKKCLLFVITGDIDFAPAIRAAKRKGFEVILLYGTNTSQDLKNCATESHPYNDIVDPPKCMFTQTNGGTAPTNAFTSRLFDIGTINVGRPVTSAQTTVSSERLTSNQQTNQAQNIPPFIEEVQNTVRRIENQNRVRSKSEQQTNETEYDPQKVKTVQDVAQVERHIALRVLQSTRGDVNLAINLLVSD